MSLIGIITTITAVKKVHDGLYENNEKYRETADRTANDAIDGVEFVRGCASDWFLWAELPLPHLTGNRVQTCRRH